VLGGGGDVAEPVGGVEEAVVGALADVARGVEAEAHVLLPGGRSVAVVPVGEGAEELQPRGRAGRQRLAEVAAVHVAAEAGDHEPGAERGHRGVGPLPEREAVAVEVDHAAQEASEEAAVGDEPAGAQLQDLERRGELVEVGEEVEHPRADDGHEGREDVAVGHLVAGQALPVGEPEHDVPADHEREPEHHAVRVDREVLGLELDRAREVRAAADGRGDE
jgi:hypothetical protein